MKVYPSDIEQAVRQSKEIAERSKQCVQAPRPNNSQLDPQWEVVQRSRQQ